MYFCFCFIALLSLSQGLRFAPLGIPPALVMVLVYGAMTLVAFALLRSRLEYVVSARKPLHSATPGIGFRRACVFAVGSDAATPA